MDKECIVCKTIINNKLKYCSKECSYIARDIKRGRLPKEDRQCLFCNSLILSTEHRDKVYCTKKCKETALAKKAYRNLENRIIDLDKYKHLISDEVGEIYLKCSGTKYKDIEFLVDRKYVDLIYSISKCWQLNTKGYIRTRYDIKLHRIITQLKYGEIPNDKVVDHINRNKLDNRECNLRLATTTQNNFNRELKPNAVKFKGVYKNKDKFVAQISIDNKVKHLGRFCTPEEAALAYNEAALKYQGEFAVLNIVPENS